MIYLEKFVFPGSDDEFNFFNNYHLNCHKSYYPFQILTKHNFTQIDFEPVTILCGSNGCGKSTALNIIAEKLGLSRDSAYSRTDFFPKYTALCSYVSKIYPMPKQSRIITSDDVFDCMFNLRNINQNIDSSRKQVFDEYFSLKSEKYSDFTMKSLEEYDTLKKLARARKSTLSTYTRNSLPPNLTERSNGENAFLYFTEKIKEGGLYLLDEPENSLSAHRQIELASLIRKAAKYYDCQFIISTHSVFLLAIKQAKIYDLDENPVDVKPWTQLKISQLYHDFFKRHDDEFDDE